MRYVLIFFLLYNSSCSNEKYLTAKIIDSNIRDFYFPSTDSIFRNIHANSEFALVAGSINPSSFNMPKVYFILAKQKNIWHCFKYVKKSIHGVTEPSFTLQEKPISKYLGDSIFSVFKENNLWDIVANNGEGCFDNSSKPTNDTLKKYPCDISDALTSQLITFYNHKIINIKEYYAPEYYNLCCPTDTNRDTFIKANNAISIIKSKFY